MRDENQLPAIKNFESLINQVLQRSNTKDFKIPYALVDKINAGYMPDLDSVEWEQTKNLPSIRETLLSFLGYYREQKGKILEYFKTNNLTIPKEYVVNIDEEKKKVLSRLIDVYRVEEKVIEKLTKTQKYHITQIHKFFLPAQLNRLYSGEIILGDQQLESCNIRQSESFELEPDEQDMYQELCEERYKDSSKFEHLTNPAHSKLETKKLSKNSHDSGFSEPNSPNSFADREFWKKSRKSDYKGQVTEL